MSGHLPLAGRRSWTCRFIAGPVATDFMATYGA